jgi:hypothetical protein
MPLGKVSVSVTALAALPDPAAFVMSICKVEGLPPTMLIGLNDLFTPMLPVTLDSEAVALDGEAAPSAVVTAPAGNV